MGEDHSPTTTNPHDTMTYGFPFSTNQQLIVDMANSCKQTLDLVKDTNTRTNDLDDQFAKRVHELMQFRTHNVDTDGF